MLEEGPIGPAVVGLVLWVCVCVAEAEGDATKCHERVLGELGFGSEGEDTKPRSGSRVHGRNRDSLGHTRVDEVSEGLCN